MCLIIYSALNNLCKHFINILCLNRIRYPHDVRKDVIMQYSKFKAFLIPLFLSTPIYAVTIDSSKSNVEIAFAEGNKLELGVSTGAKHTSNFLYAEKNEESDVGYTLSADSFMQMHNEQQLLQLYAKVTRNQFSDFSNDNHTTTSAIGKYFLKLSSEQRLFATATYNRAFEYRGTGLSLGNGNALAEGDERDDTLFNIGYQYGRADSTSRFNITAGVFDSEYQTRTAETSRFNYKRNFIASNLDYLATGATYITLTADYSDFAYDDSSMLDRNELLLLAGIKNQLSTASSVALLLGSQKVSNDVGDGEKSEFAWNATYNWYPTEFLSLWLVSEKKTNETPENRNELRIDERYSLASRYELSDKLAFNAKAQIIKADIESDGSQREDDLVVYDLGLTYSFNENINVFIQLQHQDRDSQLDNFSYQRTDSTFGVSVKF